MPCVYLPATRLGPPISPKQNQMGQGKEKNAKLNSWSKFLVYEGTDRMNEINDMIEDDKNLKKAHGQFEKLSEDEAMCDLALRRFMLECDRKILIAEAEDAKEEGRQEGREEGRAEGKKEGKIEGALLDKQALLVRLLKLKFNHDDEATSFINQVGDQEKLDRALDTGFTAQAAEKVFDILKDRKK